MGNDAPPCLRIVSVPLKRSTAYGRDGYDGVLALGSRNGLGGAIAGLGAIG